MVIDASLNDVTLRQRHISTLPSAAESASTDSSDNASIESDRCSDTEFDTNISTMDSKTAEELVKTTKNMSHDAALEKLKEVGAKTPILPSEIGTDFSFKRKIVWTNAMGFLALHICAVIGALLGIFGFTKFYTLLYSKFIEKFRSFSSANFVFFVFLTRSTWSDVCIGTWRHNGCSSLIFASRIQSENSIESLLVVASHTCRTSK